MSSLMKIVNKNNYGRLLNGNQYWIGDTDMPLDEAKNELARLQAWVAELETASVNFVKANTNTDDVVAFRKLELIRREVEEVLKGDAK